MPRLRLVLGLLTTFLLFFLPTRHHHVISLTVWGILCDLFARLTPWLTSCSDWLIPMNLAAPVMHSWKFWTFFPQNIFLYLMLWTEHAGRVLETRLLWSGGLSDCNSSSAFFPWDHCRSGRRCCPSCNVWKLSASDECVVMFLFVSCIVFVLQIDEEVAKLLELKAQLGGDDGKHQFVLKTAKVGAKCCYVLTKSWIHCAHRSLLE